MKDVNKIILIGRLGADPEERFTKDGRQYACFSLATSRKRRVKVAEGQTPEENTYEYQDDTQWHRVVCWGYLARITVDLLKKGHAVYIEGYVRASRIENAQGDVKNYYEVIAENLSLLEKKTLSQKNKIEALENKLEEESIPF